MNLFDLCQALMRAIGKGMTNLGRGLGYLVRLSYRQWWIMLLFMVLGLSAALYYSRPSNKRYKVNVVADLNGVTKEMVKSEWQALDNATILFEHQNLATMLGIEPELSYSLSRFRAFNVVDLLADSTIDVIDYHNNMPLTDTLYRHMPNLIALQFQTKMPNRIPEIEQAIVNYLNTRPCYYNITIIIFSKLHHNRLISLDHLLHNIRNFRFQKL